MTGENARRVSWFERDPGDTTSYVAPSRLHGLDQVTEFHRAFGHAISEPWTPERADFRAALIMEECGELVSAVLLGNRENIAQELADLAYVTIGTAVTFGLSCAPLEIDHRKTLRARCLTLRDLLTVGNLHGIEVGISWVIHALYDVALEHRVDLAAAITAVHTANMTKMPANGEPTKHPGGKVLKVASYRPPDMTTALMGA